MYTILLTSNTFLPVYSSLPVTSPNANIKQIIIFIHGIEAGANSMFCNSLGTVPTSLKSSTLVIIAPWFGSQQVSGSYRTGQATGTSQGIYFSDAVCDGGEYAVGNFITSFDALDALLYQVSSTFSSATLITLAGFSAGGQMMNRYSFFSPLKIATSSKARVRLIVADPGSYLYLDNKRPDASCVTLTNTGIGASCSSFSVPATGTTTCKSYNNFKYGFADLSTYASVSPYVSAYSNSTLLSQAISSYIKKDINYLIGTLDVCNCNYAGMVNDASCASQTTTTCSTTVGTLPCCDTYPDSSSNSLDTSCWGMLQGSSRLQRATNYRDYLRNYYGVTSTSFSTFSGAHNTSALFSSTSYLNFAFSASGTGNEFDQGQGTLGGGTGGSNTNSIIGGAIGGVILLVGLIIGLIARNKFNKKHSFGGEAEVSKI